MIQFTPFFTTIALVPSPETYNQAFMQRLSVPRPSTQLPGPLFVRCDAINFYTDIYFPDGTPAQQPFGGTEPRFESPVIDLVFYLKIPGQVPSQRNPMFRRILEDATTHIGHGEQLIAIWPSWGASRSRSMRERRMNMVGTVRLGAISYSYQGTPSVVTTETTIGTANVNGTAGTEALITQSVNAQYLAAYYTASAGTAGFIEGHMLADDVGACCGVFETTEPPLLRPRRRRFSRSPCRRGLGASQRRTRSAAARGARW